MRDFLRRYSVLFQLILPAILLTGVVAGPVSLAVTAAGFGYLYSKNRHDAIIILFVTILVLGDSRVIWLQFIKALRVEILIMIAVVTYMEYRQKAYRINSEFVLFLPFLFVSVLSLVFSPMLNTAVVKTLSFALLYFVSFHYIYHKFQHYGMRLLRDVMHLSHTVLVVGLFLFPLVPALVSYGGIRFNGLLGNPNGMGIFITLITPITVYIFHNDPRITGRYKALAWFLILFSLLLCSSRNAIFSFTLFIIIYHALNGGNFRRAVFLLVVLPMVIVIVSNIEFESLVINLGLEKYFRIKDFQSGSGRVFAWQHAWDLIQENPVIGCGFACEEFNFLHRTTFRLWRSGHQGGVHNSYLAYLINTGYVGFGFYVFYWYNIFRKIKDMIFIIPFVASVAFSAMFESWMFSSLSAFHIFFLLMVVWLIVAAKQTELIEAGSREELDTRMQLNIAT